jgi:predicted amidophosphoribosyltransferase
VRKVDGVVPLLRDLSGAVARIEAYERVMLTPQAGFGVCRDCFNLTAGWDRCFACTQLVPSLDAIVPISYSVAREKLNAALAGYKRERGRWAQALRADLAVILERFLELHEGCVALAAGVDRFDLVTTVPSGDRGRDAAHPLRSIVGEMVDRTQNRYQRLLHRSEVGCSHRRFDRRRFISDCRLEGERVLLVDDTWTTGASAHSAAAALREAGASTVAAIVVGRHVNRSWHENDVRLQKLRPFDWCSCVVCSGAARGATPPNSRPRATSPFGSMAGEHAASRAA